MGTPTHGFLLPASRGHLVDYVWRAGAAHSSVVLDVLPNAFSHGLAQERGLSDRRLRGLVADGALERLGLPQGRALAAAHAQDPLVKPKPTHADLAGSRYLVLQRLARAQKRTAAELLQLYVLESVLRRLVRSRHDDRLVLKGGMLLAAFELRRATRDVDVLALQTDSDPAAVQHLIADIASVEVDDGVEFLQDTLTTALSRVGRAPRAASQSLVTCSRTSETAAAFASRA